MFGNMNSFNSEISNCSTPMDKHISLLSNSLKAICCSPRNGITTTPSPKIKLLTPSNLEKCNSNSTSDTDSSDSDGLYLDKCNSIRKELPPIGVFWDIENCHVPKGRSAVSVARLIRDLFFDGYREAEFIVVCDVKKENAQIVQELNDAQVTLVHVSSTSKNAADEKLRQALRRFADIYHPPAAVILISSDINFAADLSDLKHRKKLHVILIHKDNISDALLLCASENYNYTEITKDLPIKEIKILNETTEVVVRNLPKGQDPNRLRNRLKQLSDNCGGRVMNVSLEIGTAILRFNNFDAAVRAQKRMDGEDVYGNKISVSNPNSVRNLDKVYSPYKVPARKSQKNSDAFVHPLFFNAPSPSQVTSYLSTPGINLRGGNISKTHLHSLDQFQLKQQQVQPNKPNQSQNCYQEGFRAIRGNHGVPVLTDYTDKHLWRPHSASFSEEKIRKVPLYENCRKKIGGSFNNLNTMEYEDIENQTPSTSFASRNCNTNNVSNGPIDLLITNLDPNLSPQDLKSLLVTMLRSFLMIINISIFHHYDGNLAAVVRVPNTQDAKFLVSRFQRNKIGNKRISISYAQNSFNSYSLRNHVVTLLQEVPGNKMPLFKFRELLETRFRVSVPVSDLYKLRDICFISEELGGRIISLNLDLRYNPSSHLLLYTEMKNPHCVLHCSTEIQTRGWAEPDSQPLPNIRIKLDIFSSKVHQLLQIHMGILPLNSFPVCYALEIKEKLPVDETGVPLEHLITCVNGVTLRISNMMKYIVWNTQDEMPEDGNAYEVTNGVKNVSPTGMVNSIALFSRELIDLLKTLPHCQLPFSRFIPAYHHHFGRQCRVSDYGFTRLSDLLETLSHVVQLIGEGNRKIITLTHAAQLRRFTSDLLRVLKVQAAKQLAISDFPAAYEKVLTKPFDPVDYGLCELTDLLEKIPENTVVLQYTKSNIIISIPKKEQTQQEISKTKKFSGEVVDLLRHAPQYGLLFNKFVPAYHHHYGHQCRVSDYGFSKLIELFEAIPEAVKIEETPDGDRKISLTPEEALKVVEDQLMHLIKSSNLSISLAALPATFLREYGFALRPELYGCSTLNELIEKLSHLLKLVKGPTGPIVVIVDDSEHQLIATKIWSLFLNLEFPTYSLQSLIDSCKQKFGLVIHLQLLEKYDKMLQITKNNEDIFISLTDKFKFAVRLYFLLFENGGTLIISHIDQLYFQKYGISFRSSDYGAYNLIFLLSMFSFLIVFKTKRNKKSITLNSKLAAARIPLPPKMQSSNSNNSDKGNNTLAWPPPPAHTYLFNSERTTTSPPKPDTPPTVSSNWKNSLWNTFNFSPSLNLHIPLPSAETSSMISNTCSLLSPTKNLLPAFVPEGQVQAPDPTEVPMPNAELLNKNKNVSPSQDSGIGCNSIEDQDCNTNFDAESTNTPKKRRYLKLAAHFTTPLNLT